jgi:predicted metalloprotease with PDZ domain
MKPKRSLLNLSIVLLITFTLAPAALGQSAPFRIEYTVRIASIEQQLFHVTANIKNIRQEQLDLSLPVWTPGWYTIENYAKNILRFQVTDAKGSPLSHSRIHKQAWRIDTSGQDKIRVDFDYRADTLALNQAKITKDFAFFTGTQLFLMIEGHRLSPSLVKFEVPQGWKIVTALKETSDPMTFSAPDYDTLVDSPAQMGYFDLTTFEVEGKPHYFASYPTGVFSKEKTETFVQMLSKIARAESEIFGGLPYEKFVYFYLFTMSESNAGGALEHANSFVAFVPDRERATPEQLMGTASHEFFHVWNVKRIRPAEMWPYDYSCENETPLLWVSEGLTNYYTNISLYRAGLIDRDQFLNKVAEAATGVENNEARAYISPAAASVSTWLGYDTPVAFGISYYTQGQNLGTLLDLSIIKDTSAAASLDDVMRLLYRDFYQQGKGFSTEDLISVINRLTKRDYHEFFRRYVSGTETPPYDEILSYAGYGIEKVTERVPVLNLDATITPKGIQITRVAPGSKAEEAGLRQGDILLSIDGVEAQRRFTAIMEKLKDKIDQSVRVAIKREEKEMMLDMKVGAAPEVKYKILEPRQPTPDQLKVRSKWIK